MSAKSDRVLPLIGVSSYGLNEEGRYNLPGEYVDAVRRAGGLPVLLPPGEPNWRQLTKRLDGLILTGGGDIAPHHYGGGDHETIYNVDESRDSFELALGEYVSNILLPTLAICRGMQIINVA
ncbi:MAG: gamma-glutamyl-gamma-aminobutyrate hydrolase family protein, partial [Gammaproteobacteria bacterium]|nr:gamma-glutamyl-gamma-aminobutyrate hydrolase family protein [Gammaproteobacteria bacterium]